MKLLKDLFASKKFVVMIAAIIIAVADRLGLDLDPEMLDRVLALAGAFIVGQGIADHGKEAAKLGAMVTVTTDDHAGATSTVTTLTKPAPVASTPATTSKEPS